MMGRESTKKGIVDFEGEAEFVERNGGRRRR